MNLATLHAATPEENAAVCDKTLIQAIAKVQSQSTLNPSSISQVAAIEALNGPKDFIPERTKAFKERRDIVVDMLNQIPGIQCIRPDGAFYAYPSCKDLIGKRVVIVMCGGNISSEVLKSILC